MKARSIMLKLSDKGITVQHESGKLRFFGDLSGLTAADKAEIFEAKSEIIQYLLSRPSKTARIVKLDKTTAKLSFSQQRLWFIDRLQSGSPEYNLATALEIVGTLDLGVMTKVFNTILERHEVLRTIYVENDGEIFQIVCSMDNRAFEIKEEYLCDLTSETQEEEIRNRVKAEIAAPFNLAQDLMLRVRFFWTSNDTGVLVFNMHHIASDGWSMEVLVKECFTLYHAFIEGHANPLPELQVQYADYAHWQRNNLAGEVLESQIRYWEGQLSDLPALHSLPLDKSRPSIKQHLGAHVTGTLSADVATALLSLAKTHQLTPFMLLHAALCLLLSRHSNNHDIVIGTPVANRLQAELEPLIGFFVNTLVLRVDTHHESLSDYFAHIQQVHLDAQSHQDVPFEQLVERLNIPRSESHGPLFQIMMTTNTDYGFDTETKLLTFPDVTIRSYQTGQTQSKFDLDINLSISKRGVGLRWSYDTSLFTQSHIIQLNDHLCRLLSGLSQIPVDARESPFDLPMLSEGELCHLLHDLNYTVEDYPKDKCIHELFEEQAAVNPEKEAVVYGEDKITYGALNAKANQLAHYLRTTHAVQPETLVGVCVDRSIDMVVGILGILKAGGAYVPLDPNYPQERISYMIEDAGVDVILCLDKNKDVLMPFKGTLVSIDNAHTSAAFDKDSSNCVNIGLKPSDLAYVIYTSGSTGKPKGVMIEHKALVNYQLHIQSTYSLTEADRVLQFSNICFDIFVEEFFGALCRGASLILSMPECREGLSEFVDFCNQYGVSFASVPTAFWAQVISEKIRIEQTSLTIVVVGGEALTTNTVKGHHYCFGDAVKLINTYGPTEATITASTYVTSDGYEGVPIGKANINYQLFVLGDELFLAPFGTTGGLYIGGDGLARGYLNRPELTQASFINNPYFDETIANSPKRLYRTGDLVRYLEDGNLAFIGRADDQMKIRGFRIEPKEVELSLSKQIGVDSALVLAMDVAGSTQLVGYLKSEQPLSDSSQVALVGMVKQGLLKELPKYMIPAVLMVVDEWPLTPNGKIDRKALPAPDGSALQGNYETPVTEIEQTLAGIWSGLLQLDVDKISRTANFFELGGHSLLSIRLISQVRSAFAVELPVHVVFDTHTLAELADGIATYAVGAALPPITAIARTQGTYPVSFSQQRLWFIDRLQGETPEYNMPLALSVTGPLDVSLVHNVFTQILTRHEVLRTVYVEDNGVVKQRICAPSEVDFTVDVLHICELTEAAQKTVIKDYVQADRTRSFDLSRDVMLRVGYVRTNAETGVLVFNMHHIASDGWSMDVLTQEFLMLYEALSQGQTNPLPPLDIQYADYAHWQRTYLEGAVLEQQLAYWQKQLEGLPVLHDLPLSYPRPAEKSYTGGIVSDKLSSQVGQSLRTLAQAHQLTPFMLLHGAVSLLLSRHSNNADIVIGIPVANRTQEALTPLIGFFVNTLVLRTNTAYDGLSDYLQHVRQVHLDAQSNQNVPFEQLVEKLNIPRTKAHSPLFQIMMTTNTDYGLASERKKGQALKNVSLSRFGSDTVTAKFDLDVDISITDAGVAIRWTYDVSLFSEQRISTLNTHLCRLLTDLSVVEDSVELHSLAILSEAESTHLIAGLNNKVMDYPKDICIHEMFEQQALAHPDSIAVVFEDKELTYRQLNEKANQLARYLVEEHEVVPDTLVGLCVERSLDMVIGLIGILKAGGAYVPLDPSYPEERLNYMMEDAGLAVVLSRQELQAIPSFTGQVVCLDDSALVIGNSVDNLHKSELGLTSSNLAYVIYTSGSTGNPKGVMIEHKGLLNTIVDNAKRFELNQQSVFLQSTSISFDAAAWVIWMTLCTGSTLRLASSNEYEYEVTCYTDITHIMMTPSMLELISVENKNHISHVIVGGEQCSVDLMKQWLACDVKFYNAYGPTEVSICSSLWKASTSEQVLIGQAIANTQSLVLNENQTISPQGTIGELYIGGAGLARGYLNRPELTAERFVDNPYYDTQNPNSSKRLYRTGDLVRYLADGNLEFIGRTDDQVKIRGFRIELGEVEAQLTLQSGVDSALVITKELAGSQQLVGYIKSAEVLDERAQAEFVQQVKKALLVGLPEYMVPSILIVVSTWPLTPNGKIDRKALPAPGSALLHSEYIAPETETEEALVGIWSELLGIARDKISTSANFFDLGGHSLLSIRLMSKIRQQFCVELPIQTIFDSSNLSELAAAIASGSANVLYEPVQPIGRTADEYPVSFSQQRLWFIDRLQGGTPEYNMPMALEVKGTLDVVLVNDVFTAIIKRHEVLRTIYAEVDGEVRQHIRPMSEVSFSITVKDMRGLSKKKQSEAIKSEVESDITHPFNLAQDVMLRVSYLRTSENSGVLLFNMHHIASDGWSMEVLSKEFFALYDAFSQGKENPLPALEIQYVDYAHWQRNHLEGARLDRQLEYWVKHLDGVPAVHNVLLSYPRPKVKAYKGATVSGELSSEVSQSLRRLARKHQLTLFMILHGALSLLLSRHSNESDIVIGTPMANRIQGELTPLIGYFANTLVLRANTNQASLADYFKHIRQLHLDAQSNQDVPFEQLVERLKVARSTAHSPLFQIMMSTNADYGVSNSPDVKSLPGLNINPYQSDVVQVKFDLDIVFNIHDAGVGIYWTYDVSLFSEQRISTLNTHLCRLLTDLSVVEDSVELHSLAILSEAESRHLIAGLNNKVMDYPKDICIHEMFEQQALAHPDSIAVVFEDKELTYRQLNEKANQLARYLVEEHEVVPDTLVGLCVERSLDMVIGLIGILKAGGAYVPLDPEYPAARLEYMREDAGLRIILTQQAVADKMEMSDSEVVLLDSGVFNDYDSTNLSEEETGVTAQHLAYVIYTSGSTGNPKGVMIEHRSVAALQDEMAGWFTEVSRVGWVANFVFDASVQGLIYLFAGRTLIIVPEYMKMQPTLMLDYIKYNDIELLDCTPSLLQFWLDAWGEFTPPNFLVGGEPISAALWQRLSCYSAKGVKALNVYGPTECTVNSTSAAVERDVVHIGKKLPYTQLYILQNDKTHTLVPYGVVGELYLGGVGLARGYLNRPELTAERFVDNPYYDTQNPNSSKRLYRTGDLVRYLADGNLEFIGRTDDQVKIRGFRIELGEVEAQLTLQSGVDSALVITKELAGSQQLVGYIKSAEELDESAQAEFVQQVKKALLVGLPEYMVPSILIVVSTWPLTPNGKIDRKALPAPGSTLLHSEYIAPETETEEALVGIWSELLGIARDKISTSANFFDLGGHSLLTIKLVSGLRKRYDENVSVQNIFAAKTLKELAALISEKSSTDKRHEGLIPLSSMSGRPKMYLIHPYGGTVDCYYLLANQINSHQVIGLVAPFVYGENIEFAQLEQLADHYVSIIDADLQQNEQRHCVLGGFSFGGAVAALMVGRLVSKGVTVEGLMMLDSYVNVLRSANSNNKFEEYLAIAEFLNIPAPSLDFQDSWYQMKDTELFDAFAKWLLEHIKLPVEATETYQFIQFHSQLGSCGAEELAREVGCPILLVMDDSQYNAEAAQKDWRCFIKGKSELYKVNCRHQEFLSAKGLENYLPRLQRWLAEL